MATLCEYGDEHFGSLEAENIMIGTGTISFSKRVLLRSNLFYKTLYNLYTMGMFWERECL
jgi:hypothetical protein